MEYRSRQSVYVIALRAAALAAVGVIGLVAAFATLRVTVDSWTTMASTSEIPPLNYTINTRYGTSTAACNASAVKKTPATLGVPALVDVGGSSLPDISVLIVGLPGVGEAPPTVELEITRLRSSRLYTEVEIVYGPDATSSERIAVGYNGCEYGAPNVLNGTMIGTQNSMEFTATTALPLPALTLFGSTFNDDAGTRVQPMSVKGRLAPMPTFAYLRLYEAGLDSYHAHVDTLAPTEVKLDYSDVKATSTTTASAVMKNFPGQMVADFSPTKLEYTAADPLGMKLSKPIALVDFTLVSTGAGKPTDTLRATLEQVPAKGKLERLSKTRVEFTAPAGPIGVTTLFFSSAPPAGSAPGLPPLPAGQYLVARSEFDGSAAGQVRVTGLSHALIDAGDETQGVSADGETDLVPLVVDATHTAGSFRVDASLTRVAETLEEKKVSPTITRAVTATVLDLPATARVEFGAKTQSFSYVGAAPIGKMDVFVTSNLPFTDDATAAHLYIENFPTGLSGRFDEVAKKFRANLTGGAVGKIEVQVTSGPDLRLPEKDADGAPLDGVLVEDHEGAYTAFARIKGLQRVEVGWGDSQLADVAHLPGRFKVDVDVDDPDSATATSPATDLDFLLVIKDLPGTAKFEYKPAKKVDPECTGDECAKTPSDLVFTGDADVALITADIVSGQTLIDGGEKGNAGAKEIHATMANIPAATPAHPGLPDPPPSLHVYVDGTNKNMFADLGTKRDDFALNVEACSLQVCGSSVNTWKATPGGPTVSDGLWLLDHKPNYHLVARITGLKNLTLSWKDPVTLHAEKKAGRFDIVLLEDKKWKDPDVFPRYNPPVADYESRTAVVVKDLPASVHLTYFRSSKQVIYSGSDGLGNGTEIGSLQAWHSVDPVVAWRYEPRETCSAGGCTIVLVPVDHLVNAIAGNATEAHAVITGLPANVSLTMAVTETDTDTDVLELTAAPATTGAAQPTIGEIRIELASSLEVLAKPTVQGIAVMSTDDGLILWNLDNGNATKFEPVGDPYLIVAHVTRLQKFRSVSASFTDVYHSYRTLELLRDSRAGLTLDIRKHGSGEPTLPLADFGAGYKYKHLTLAVDLPPKHLNATLTVGKQTDGDLRTAEINYYASEPANSMTFTTSAGSRTTAFVAPVPAVPDFSGEGIHLCYSPASMECNANHQSGYADEGYISVELAVAEPVHIVVTKSNTGWSGGFNVRAMDLDLYVDEYLQVSKESDTDYCNEHMLYVDTKGKGINGTLVQYGSGGTVPTGGTTLDVYLPPGTSANERWVRLIGPPCKGAIYTYNVPNRPRGTMVCPAGLDIIYDAFEDIDVHIEDELCPEPRIYSVLDENGQPAVVSRSGQFAEVPGGTYDGIPSVGKVIHLYGVGFAPSTCVTTEEVPGQDDESEKDDAVVDKLTCDIPSVLILGGGVHVVSGEWVDSNHIVLTVDVETTASLGGRVVAIDNPETGSGTCTTQEFNDVTRLCFEVVE